MMRSPVYLILLLALMPYVDAQTYNDASNLYNSLLRGYLKQVRPVSRQTDPVHVNITYDIGGIQEINEVEGTMTVFINFHYNWVDQRLTWNPALYNNTYSVAIPVDLVWKPELALVNPAGSTTTSVESSMTMVRFYFNGFAAWFPSGVVTVACAVNIQFYPYDTQSCPVMFIASNYFSSELTVLAVNKEAPLTYYISNGVWDVAKTEATVQNEGVNLYTINLTLTRKPLFIVIIVIIPIMLLSFLNILVFLLPPDSGERMSFSITLLLALAVFLTIISDNIPKTSSPLSILCYFIGLHVLLSTIISVVTILNLRLYYKNEEKSVPSWVCSCFRKGEKGQEEDSSDDKSTQNGPKGLNSVPFSINGGANTGTSGNYQNIPVFQNGGIFSARSNITLNRNGGFNFVKGKYGRMDTPGKMPNPKYSRSNRSSDGNQLNSNTATKGKPKFTWKVMSGYIDWIMFIVCILYFVIAFLVFMFVTLFMK